MIIKDNWKKSQDKIKNATEHEIGFEIQRKETIGSTMNAK